MYCLIIQVEISDLSVSVWLAFVVHPHLYLIWKVMAGKKKRSASKERERKAKKRAKLSEDEKKELVDKNTAARKAARAADPEKVKTERERNRDRMAKVRAAEKSSVVWQSRAIDWKKRSEQMRKDGRKRWEKYARKRSVSETRYNNMNRKYKMRDLRAKREGQEKDYFLKQSKEGMRKLRASYSPETKKKIKSDERWRAMGVVPVRSEAWVAEQRIEAKNRRGFVLRSEYHWDLLKFHRANPNYLREVYPEFLDLLEEWEEDIAVKQKERNKEELEELERRKKEEAERREEMERLGLLPMEGVDVCDTYPDSDTDPEIEELIKRNTLDHHVLFYRQQKKEDRELAKQRKKREDDERMKALAEKLRLVEPSEYEKIRARNIEQLRAEYLAYLDLHEGCGWDPRKD